MAKSTTKSYAAHSASSLLEPFSFERREVGKDDVRLEILFCGVCHSDIHTVRNEWKSTTYPVVPGHEIVGKVTHVGNNVSAFKIGDLAGVGPMVDSCRKCNSCIEHLEQYCENEATFTYNSEDKYNPGKMTYGGYSTHIIADQNYVVHVSKRLDPAATAPLLCAGITTYSPLRHWRIGKGQKVGIVGLGGLGHMGVKFAHALGAEVVLFTTSPSKKKDAMNFGAHEVVISTDHGKLSKHASTFDFILNTVAAPYSLDMYLQLLKREGVMCLVGIPGQPYSSSNFTDLIFKRRQLAGSLIGGIKETQEMLNFCAEQNITSDIEIIPMQKINEAYERMIRGDVRYRFVIDLNSLKI